MNNLSPRAITRVGIEPSFLERTKRMISEHALPQLAADSSSKQVALDRMQKINPAVKENMLVRKLNNLTGEGFWDCQLGSQRIVCYGKHEYVQPHYHDIEEKFTIKSGGCHVYLSADSKNWEYRYYEYNEDLVISGGCWHCLVAGEDGLSMEVFNDNQRTINWLDFNRSSRWETNISYETSIQDLVEKTIWNAKS